MRVSVDKIVIGDLFFYGHCGITPEEQVTGHRFSVDIEIPCDVAQIARTDRLENAFDYAAISRRLVEIAGQEKFCLIETMAERLAQVVLDEFDAKRITLRLRKHAPPIETIMAYSGVEIYREKLND